MWIGEVVGHMVAPLELMRMRLLVFLWDKMHMKMVILLCSRDVVPFLLLVVAVAVVLHFLLLELSLVQLLQGLVMMLPEGLVTVHLQGLLMMLRGVLLMIHKG